MFYGTTTVAQYGKSTSADTSPGLSLSLWGQVLQRMRPGNHIAIGEDFEAFGLSTAVSSNVGRYAGRGGQAVSYEDTSFSLAVRSERGGVLRFSHGTDNEEASLQWCDDSAAFVISDTAGEDFALAFEARVKFGSIANDVLGGFVGLAEENAAAHNFIADAGTMVDKDFIGFHRLEGDGDAIDFIYKKNGQTQQSLISDMATIAADTYVKLGFLYDPEADASERITAFVNGVPQSTKVTAALIAAATFPDGEEMSPIAGVKLATGSAHTMDMDWIACVQFREKVGRMI